MRKARCVISVLVFEPGIVGDFKAGQIVEGENAESLLHDHPDYFQEVFEGEEN